MLCTFVSYVWSMVSKATIIVNYIAHPNDPRNPFAESLYSLRLSEVCGVTSLSKKLYASPLMQFFIYFLAVEALWMYLFAPSLRDFR